MVFHEEARKLIENRINMIVDFYDFETRSKEHPEECQCYQDGNKCHDMNGDKLSCLLCLCPEYNRKVKMGGCKLGNPQGKGKWFVKPDNSRIWDCSDCSYPHNKEVVKKYLRKIWRLK